MAEAIAKQVQRHESLDCTIGSPEDQQNHEHRFFGITDCAMAIADMFEADNERFVRKNFLYAARIL